MPGNSGECYDFQYPAASPWGRGFCQNADFYCTKLAVMTDFGLET
ncbi:hypothetical protein SUBVAR_06712 [Subdoligranulum variabile DSM 15176]|uniref:Uncharacterized protein n=1 Tax=Subdoligranulum variabile DSM 15176 TaxID=411471 RepID=D1PQP3_9FIRM|nr:hypothetical protein SUBVAR_06712 [Subdoligranulum variabile DSM 15176]